MTTYTTAQIDTVVRQLEANLGAASAKVRTSDGREIEYKSNADIRNALSYWKGLYSAASDAPASATPRVRTFRMFGGKGIGPF